MGFLDSVRYLKIIIVILVVVLLAGFYYFVSSDRDVVPTGFAVSDIVVDGEVYENLTDVSREEALEHLNEGERIMNEMAEAGFPSLFISDKLLEARRVFEQAEYAEILREEINSSESERLRAEEALRLLDWENILYDDVITHVNQIKERRDRTFVLHDSLVSTKISLMRDVGMDTPITGMVSLTEGVNESTGEEVFILHSLEGIDEETRELFSEASVAFYEDREDAIDLLIELREHLDSKRLETARSSVLKNNLVDFIERNWIAVLFFLVLLGVAAYVAYKNFVYRGVKERVEKMKVERRVIIQLMKKLQQERFKENKVSELVYKIRMKKYKSKLSMIKSKLPVLEAKLVI
jgi:hypothetical protein